MAYIPLVEHTHPRVLMIDFPQSDVQKIQKAGFEVKRGASGVLKNDQQQFCLPYAVQDVEIVFAEVHRGTFFSGNLKPHESSVHTEFVFSDLMREVWSRNGWLVFFVKEGCTPVEFNNIGISLIGVLADGRVFDHPKIRDQGDPEPSFPSYSGHGLHIDETQLGSLLSRFT